MMFLTKLALYRKSAAFILILILCAYNYFIYNKMPQESQPRLTLPIVFVMVTYDFMPPQQAASTIAPIIEGALRGLPKVEQTRTRVNSKNTQFIIRFAYDQDIALAYQDVNDRINAIKFQLPEDMRDNIVVRKISLSDFSDVTVNLLVGNSTLDMTAMSAIAKSINDELTSLNGVRSAEISGHIVPDIEVHVDPKRLEQASLSVSKLKELLKSLSEEYPTGSIVISNKTYQLFVPGRISSVEDIQNITIQYEDNRAVKLKNLADIKYGVEESNNIELFKNQHVISFEIHSEGGSDVLTQHNAIAKIFDKYKYQYKIDYEIIDEGADDVAQLKNNMISGILSSSLLVIVVITFFMGFTSSVFIAALIPFSVFSAVTVMHHMGYSLNILVIIGLIITLGLLVDNGIVVMETYFRYIKDGYKRDKAVIGSIQEIWAPLLSSTLTTSLAFSPMLFWNTVFGQYFTNMTNAIMITVAISYVGAIFIIPLLLSIFKSSEQAALKQMEHEKKAYRYIGIFIAKTVNNYKLTFYGIIGICLAIIVLYVIVGKDPASEPPSDKTLQRITVTAANGITKEEIFDKMTKMREALTNDSEDIRYFTERVSDGSARYTIYLKNQSDRKEQDAESLIANFTKILSNTTDVTTSRSRPASSAISTDFSLSIVGNDLEQLAKAVDMITPLVEHAEGIVSVTNDLQKPNVPQLDITLNNKGKYLGVTPATISDVISQNVQKISAGKYIYDNNRYNIRIKLDRDAGFDNISYIKALPVPTTYSSKTIPIGDIADVKYTSGYGTITRQNGTQTVIISGAINTTYSISEVERNVKTLLETVRLPSGVTLKYTGSQDLNESVQFLKMAVLISSLLIFFVLLLQFNSILQTTIIMSAIIMSIAGVLLGLMITGDSPYLSTFIGMLTLAGIVVNDAIVLIDYANIQRKKGYTYRQAGVIAAKVRLEPVLLTSLTTISGMLPMAMGLNLDLDTYTLAFQTNDTTAFFQPMAKAIIYGMISATFLTLLFVPSAYIILGQAELAIADFKAHFTERIISILRKIIRFIKRSPWHFAKFIKWLAMLPIRFILSIVNYYKKHGFKGWLRNIKERIVSFTKNVYYRIYSIVRGLYIAIRFIINAIKTATPKILKATYMKIKSGLKTAWQFIKSA